MRWKK